MSLTLRGVCALSMLMATTMLVAADVGEPPEAKRSAQQQPDAAEPAEKPDPFHVPDGSPAELLEYIVKLQRLRPDGNDVASPRQFSEKRCRAMVAAASKALAQKPTDQQAAAVVRVEVAALKALAGLGDAAAPQQLESLRDELQQSGRKQLAREVHGVLLGYKLSQSLRNGPEELDKSLAAIRQFVGAQPAEMADASLAIVTARTLELSGNTRLAADAYRDFGKILSASKEPRIAKIGATMAGALRRVTLVGKPMPLEGTFLDGEPFDWARYKDKVVLVQFWATWCGPCRAEFITIKQDYDRYHDRGFEVVGINCDDTREALVEYLAANPLPWKSIFSSDPAGWNTPMATYYGVQAIPQLMLIGKDGKVVSMNVRGPRLRQELEKLLGPVEEDEAKAGAPTAAPSSPPPVAKEQPAT